MGYSEILCTICGVSFNIARIRRRDEPKEAAWAYNNNTGSFLEVDDLPSSFESCGRESGCTYYNRIKDDGVYKSPWKSSKHDKDPVVSAQNARVAIDAMKDDCDEDLEYDDSDKEGESEFEHIAGPGCKSYNGYSAYLISSEEMQGCTTFQCLVHKSTSWQPAADDEDFERDPQFPMFLSGLCDYMPDREDGFINTMYPMRHNMQGHIPDHIAWDFNDYTDYSVPFHPSCLEIYKRVSTQLHGSVDMLGLVQWHKNGTSAETFEGFHPSTTRTDDVGYLNEQWWAHNNETEYVAANPLFIPGLAAVVETSLSPHNIDSNMGAFDLPASSNLAASPGDPFATLPMELRLAVLSSLPNADLSNLRLASRVFRQLPVSVWHGLVLQDMPWLWEAWPADKAMPYPFLATTTERRLRANPSIEPNRVPVPNMLPSFRMNWYKLYCSIKRGIHDGTLKGLQNRKRIWADCEAIALSIRTTSETI
ncbi:Putative F-box domain-containing protein [Septoria linicola]|uniref:F-box domain-containing protein n=1 Tax=Septoria linicola TaxID=215465 RepID=A0A9Q9B0V1_9PEZI|nr:putative F-box domain-containing protein [Septoria linicola]USW58909.1 Putative F-box domain-containing protein [Septoria linicola]